MKPSIAIVFQRADATIAIGYAMRHLRIVEGQADETELEYLDSMAAKILADDPGLVEVARLPFNEIPDDSADGSINDTGEDSPDITAAGNTREFRAAWRWDGAAITKTAANKRTVIIARLRAMRDRQLNASDIEIMKATEQNNAASVTAWTDYRQALRDLPATVVGVNTLAGIKLAWPVKPA